MRKYVLGSYLKKKIFFTVIVLAVIFLLHGGCNQPYFAQHMQVVRCMGYLGEEDKVRIKVGLLLKELTAPEAKIAVGAAGQIPYFSERYCIDLLGKCDPYIARQKGKTRSYQDFVPGHNKYDYGYSIVFLKPDIAQSLRWVASDEDINKYIAHRYITLKLYTYDFFFRKHSTHINWEKVNGLKDTLL